MQTYTSPYLDIEIGSKRKSESLNIEIAEVVTIEKKTQVDTENDYLETAKVARQPR